MKVGIYLDLRNPPGWLQDPARLYGFTLELCEEADALGCDSIWFSEHHLFDDGYLPQPLTMAAAAAARTRRARIGTAVVVAPLHHPVDLAEQSAVVDLVSAGRLELGLGAGYRLPEFELFGAGHRERYRTTATCVRELRRLWGGVVSPRPVQERVPIWLGYFGPFGSRQAGLLGEGLLSAHASQWPAYRAALEEAGHGAASGRMAGGVHGWVAEDPDAEWPVVARHLAHQFDSYRRHMVAGTGARPPAPVDPAALRDAGGDGALDSFLFGTAADVAAGIAARTAGAPVERVFLWASLSGMAEDLVVAHVRRICTDLAPRLAGLTPTAEPA